MCNLYNVTTNQEAIRALFSGLDDKAGNLPPSLDVFPDRLAPVIRANGAGHELVNLTWGMPTAGARKARRARLRDHQYSKLILSALAAVERRVAAMPGASDGFL